MLFRLRGRSQEQILQALRQRRAGLDQASARDQDSLSAAEEREIAQPSTESLARYYELAGPLDEFSVAIKAPPIEIPLLKRLGEPAFAEEPGLRYLLLPAYRLVSMEAIRAAFGDVTKPPSEDNEPSNGDRSTPGPK